MHVHTMSRCKFGVSCCVNGEADENLGNRGRCQDKKGSFMVETTKWEGTTPSMGTASVASTDWHDANSVDYSEAD